MDKKKLNNEIVLCRPAVRKAKVAVIRKFIKKMKLLKACKVEAMKEKKLKKSERLFKKVQIMKKIKVDEVTKFALRHSDIEELLKMPKPNIRQNVLANLAKHKSVATRVNSIRNQFENWEVQLPMMLDSLGKKKRKTANIKQETAQSSKTATSSDKVNKKDGNHSQLKNDSVVKTKARQTGRLSSQGTSSDKEKCIEEPEKIEQIKKIDDPFFIGKKVVAPKLALESLADKKNTNKSEKLEFPIRRDNSSSLFQTKPFKTKTKEIKTQKPMPEPEVETLHPSWAAKKVKMIKPFQGKKITFSDD